MINIVLQIRPILGGADCTGMVALNHRNSQYNKPGMKKILFLFLFNDI